MASIRERLKAHLGFRRFAESTSKLYREADDPEAVAEALANEDFERAQELSGLSESEFVSVLETMNDQAMDLAEEDAVQEGIEDLEAGSR